MRSKSSLEFEFNWIHQNEHKPSYRWNASTTGYTRTNTNLRIAGMRVQLDTPGPTQTFVKQKKG